MFKQKLDFEDTLKRVQDLIKQGSHDDKLIQLAAHICRSFVKPPFHAKSERFSKLFEHFEVQGMHILENHFYSPIPDSKVFSSSDSSRFSFEGVRVNWANFEHLLETGFAKYLEETNQFPYQITADFHANPKFFLDNRAFSGTDALATYSIIRERKPNLVIEVGSGFSTLLIKEALEKNGKGKIICIEPYPHKWLHQILGERISLIEKPVQEVDSNLFSLAAGDLLFIDSTHVSKYNSDVNDLFFRVLPKLKKGVLIHLHDIYLPFEAPLRWLKNEKIFWNEQYLLYAFLQHNACFSVFYSNMMACHTYSQKMRSVFKNSNFIGGGSFFIERDH